MALIAIALIAGSALVASACSSSESSSTTFKSKTIVVSNVWARESAGAADTGAVYLTIENTSGTVDKLLSASVSQSFAKSASIHEMVMSDGTTVTTAGSGSSSMMSMKEVTSVTIPANGSVTFEPGGYHIMLTGLVAPLKDGEKFDLNLGFLNGGFTAWRAGAATTAILAWMCDRFPIYGFYRHLGMAADQKLLPLVLAYFPRDVRISHSPALNIAYWNAQERPVRLDGATWRCGDENVLFFHLSGYKLSQPDLVCAYVSGAANAALLAAAPWLRDLAAQYRALLEPCIAGYTPPPYAFTRYDGVHLNADFRRLLFRRGRLSRTDRQFWRIWLVQTLRLLKRLATGVRPLR
jgi:copper(I)-binding protein